jgi:hypothetical protein
MKPTFKTYLMAMGILCVTGLAAGGARADGGKVGDTQMCVPLINIDHTQVIDNKTILIEMKGKGKYKRMDLMGSCPGLRMSGGFSHETSINQLCTSDPLHVIETHGVGATCMIKQIVTIDAAEAKKLQSKEKTKKPKGQEPQTKE